jgi:hypothetical protein
VQDLSWALLRNYGRNPEFCYDLGGRPELTVNSVTLVSIFLHHPFVPDFLHNFLTYVGLCQKCTGYWIPAEYRSTLSGHRSFLPENIQKQRHAHNKTTAEAVWRVWERAKHTAKARERLIVVVFCCILRVP